MIPSPILTARRKALDLSVRHVAAHAGVGESAVYSWEAGDKSPTPENLLRWADALRLSYRDVVRLEESFGGPSGAGNPDAEYEYLAPLLWLRRSLADGQFFMDRPGVLPAA
ncbi:helix-turn-helix domain-containing protein [Kitasatospora sp. McL0602]|uniref:helix-turn-helix domain-containing protein n=1 Tax=Kitasatospora sp. McL0602 TaxID=3439530 RepID=UPI003F8CABD7